MNKCVGFHQLTGVNSTGTWRLGRGAGLCHEGRGDEFSTRFDVFVAQGDDSARAGQHPSASRREEKGIAEALIIMPRYLMQYSGDIVWMGTDDPTRDRVPADTVGVEITGLGMLRNPVTGES